jgi:hypothetical protein
MSKGNLTEAFEHFEKTIANKQMMAGQMTAISTAMIAKILYIMAQEFDLIIHKETGMAENEEKKIAEKNDRCPECDGDIFIILYHMRGNIWIPFAGECHTCKKWKPMKGVPLGGRINENL